MSLASPITEADLHAWIDAQLSAERAREVEDYLAMRPEEAERLETYRAHKRELHALFDPVLDEPLPQRVLDAARPRTRRHLQAIAAGIVLVLLGGAAGWTLRAKLAAPQGIASAPGAMRSAALQAGDFARRAAVAHAVFSPDARRPVEVGADHEDQLVAWLSKRMGAPMKAPHLQALGYALEGGRLLPGGRGPVAQFMYRDGTGAKLTLYVSDELPAASTAEAGSSGLAGGETRPEAAFRFAQEGSVNVFYWIEGRFGYALSASASRDELARVASAVYRQLSGSR